jgi:hypothetical protein
LHSLSAEETPSGKAADRGSLRDGTRAGFAQLWADGVLRTVTISASVVTAFAQLQMAVYFLFLVGNSV